MLRLRSAMHNRIGVHLSAVSTAVPVRLDVVWVIEYSLASSHLMLQVLESMHDISTSGSGYMTLRNLLLVRAQLRV